MKSLVWLFPLLCSFVLFNVNLSAQTDTLSKPPVSTAIPDSSKAINPVNQVGYSCHFFADYVYRLFLIHEYDSLIKCCNDCDKEAEDIRYALERVWPLNPVCNYQDSANAVYGSSCLFTIDLFDRTTLQLKVRIIVYRDTSFIDELIISKVEYESFDLPAKSNREWQNDLKKEFNRQIEDHIQQGRTVSPR